MKAEVSDKEKDSVLLQFEPNNNIKQIKYATSRTKEVCRHLMHHDKVMIRQIESEDHIVAMLTEKGIQLRSDGGYCKQHKRAVFDHILKVVVLLTFVVSAVGMVFSILSFFK